MLWKWITCGFLGERVKERGDVYPVFVDIVGVGGPPTLVEVPTAGTLQDLVDQVRSQPIAFQLTPDADVTVTVGDESFEKRTLGTFLADANASAECLIVINTKPKPDVELLFEIFEDPESTKTVFGYQSYDQFRNTEYHPDHFDVEEQAMWLGRRVGRLPGCSCLEWDNIDDHICVTGLYLNLQGNVSPSSLNWDVIAGLKELTKIWIIQSNVLGKVPFDILPRKLIELRMDCNHLTAVENIKDCPPHLFRVDLCGNDIKDINPSTLAEELRCSLRNIERGKVLWMFGRDCVFER